MLIFVNLDSGGSLKGSTMQRFVLKQHFVGEPKNEDFQLVEEDLPDELKEGGKYVFMFAFLYEKSF